MTNRITPYFHLIRAHKPIGTLLLLWPTLAAIWLASHGHPTAKILIIFIAGTFLMRSAGCILNDLADIKFDSLVARTRHRPLATGIISVPRALLACFLLSLCAFLLVVQLNHLTIMMAIAGFIFSCIYPYLKRITQLPQLGLGITFNWGILMAYTAILNHVTIIAVLLYMAACIITICYDTYYAMVDKNDDQKIGIKSTAILFGRHVVFIIMILEIIALALLLTIGYLLLLNMYYYLGIGGWLCMTLYQHYIIREHTHAQYFKAFLMHHRGWLIILLGIIASGI